jgi:hypothetical protein
MLDDLPNECLEIIIYDLFYSHEKSYLPWFDYPYKHNLDNWASDPLKTKRIIWEKPQFKILINLSMISKKINLFMESEEINKYWIYLLETDFRTQPYQKTPLYPKQEYNNHVVKINKKIYNRKEEYERLVEDYQIAFEECEEKIPSYIQNLTLIDKSLKEMEISDENIITSLKNRSCKMPIGYRLNKNSLAYNNDIFDKYWKITDPITEEIEINVNHLCKQRVYELDKLDKNIEDFNLFKLKIENVKIILKQWN